ncbi:MAG: hypothetical protein M3Z24_04435 [Chloroflexota bacterium]|nr:hypothetical protein [Chloroflexota bacterium]
MNRIAFTEKYERPAQDTNTEAALRNASKDVHVLAASGLSDEEVLVHLAHVIDSWKEAAVQHGDLPDSE